MNTFVPLLVVALAIASSCAEVRNSEELTAFDYHRKFGFDLAAKIRRNEKDAAAAGLSGQRIVGGEPSDISQTPYQVGLVNSFLLLTSVCGGSLITSTRVVTAAHCHWDGVLTVRSHTVVLGSNTIFNGGHRYTTTNIVMHPNWNPLRAANDIAVIRIAAVGFSDVIQPIALPSGEELQQNFVGQSALASGFGLTGDGQSISVNQVLSSVNLNVISNSECEAVFGDFVLSSNICTSGAGGQSVCSGDSGGPLAVVSNGRRILVGTTSFGSSQGCTHGFPQAFARTTSFLSWITSI